MSFKCYYCNQLVRKTVPVIEQKLLHDVTFMKGCMIFQTTGELFSEMWIEFKSDQGW
jgi:hypothetical protein